nr:hypothetical protein KV8917_40014 [Klebsiella variicola]
MKGAPHLTQHFALQKGVKTRNPRELTQSVTGVEGRRQRIGSGKGAPHPFNPAFRVAKRRQDPKFPGAYSVSDRG